MRRIIHPVGCAAFITECFFGLGVEVVYDCGMCHGKNAPERLHNLVDNHFALSKHVDYLFISHFDNDHYNGVQYLIDQGYVNADTKVYIPLLSYSMIYVTDELAGLFYRRIVSAFSRVIPQITFVRAMGDSDSLPLQDLDIRPNNVQVMNSLDAVAIPFKGRPIWEYRPFYIQDDAFLKTFLSECAKGQNPIVEDRLKNYQNLTEEEKNKLKKIYGELKGNNGSNGPTPINMNAMLLISREVPGIRVYCSDIHSVPYTLIPYRCSRHRILSRPSCLYTSDAGLASKKSMDYVVDAVNQYMPEGIGLLQIPHHGSYKCYSSDIYRKLNFEATFVNGDLSSSNPAICADVINDAYRYDIPLYLVDKVKHFVEDIELWFPY